MSEQNALELVRKTLESERKARSKADQEVLTLWGRVMGTEEEFSTLENFHVGTYLFCVSSCWFLRSAYL